MGDLARMGRSAMHDIAGVTVNKIGIWTLEAHSYGKGLE